MEINSTHWQQTLTDAVTEVDELCRLLQLTPAQLNFDAKATAQFPLRVPRPFIAKMRKQDPRDPLLMQVLPDAQELLNEPGFTADPLQEQQHNPVPGVLHKYHGRVLLTLAGSCAVNCRYCFRRHFPYADNMKQPNWQAQLDYIAADNSITEVILSGGEPLLLKEVRLEQLFTKLAAIPHVKYIRFHTRLPVVIPARITQQLVDLLATSRFKIAMVLHINHANEIDAILAEKCRLLQKKGVQVLNQTVLLKNINDSASELTRLSHALYSASILPYYLHVLDHVAGAAHFLIDDQKATTLHATLTATLPGYLVPRLVREEPNATSKVPV